MSPSKYQSTINVSSTKQPLDWSVVFIVYVPWHRLITSEELLETKTPFTSNHSYRNDVPVDIGSTSTIEVWFVSLYKTEVTKYY